MHTPLTIVHRITPDLTVWQSDRGLLIEGTAVLDGPAIAQLAAVLAGQPTRPVDDEDITDLAASLPFAPGYSGPVEA